MCPLQEGLSVAESALCTHNTSRQCMWATKPTTSIVGWQERGPSSTYAYNKAVISSDATAAIKHTIDISTSRPMVGHIAVVHVNQITVQYHLRK